MDYSETEKPMTDEVDLLLINARLRDELEPYRDESIDGEATRQMQLHEENEYLASILAWERAPALPIRDWFDPPLQIPAPESLTDQELPEQLHQAIEQLHAQHIKLTCTDHLSDRELYCVIYRDILPCCEKKIDMPGKELEWRCVDDPETWLTFYANAIERRRFQEEHQTPLPPSQRPPHRRQLPGSRPADS